MTQTLWACPLSRAASASSVKGQRAIRVSGLPTSKEQQELPTNFKFHDYEKEGDGEVDSRKIWVYDPRNTSTNMNFFIPWLE